MSINSNKRNCFNILMKDNLMFKISSNNFLKINVFESQLKHEKKIKEK